MGTPQSQLALGSAFLQTGQPGSPGGHGHVCQSCRASGTRPVPACGPPRAGSRIPRAQHLLGCRAPPWQSCPPLPQAGGRAGCLSGRRRGCALACP
eukprot:1158858-Pelagomonas_calceolata.AAC.10